MWLVVLVFLVLGSLRLVWFKILVGARVRKINHARVK